MLSYRYSLHCMTWQLPSTSFWSDLLPIPIMEPLSHWNTKTVANQDKLCLQTPAETCLLLFLILIVYLKILHHVNVNNFNDQSSHRNMTSLLRAINPILRWERISVLSEYRVSTAACIQECVNIRWRCASRFEACLTVRPYVLTVNKIPKVLYKYEKSADGLLNTQGRK